MNRPAPACEFIALYREAGVDSLEGPGDAESKGGDEGTPAPGSDARAGT